MYLDANRWMTHFRKNRLARPEPDWQAPITLPPAVVARLVHSLEQMALGDGGGPASLIAWDADTFCSISPEIRDLVDLWFEEEKEHSRLLHDAVRRFGGKPIKWHWSFSVFCNVRRELGVRFELTALLLTEIVTSAYYRLLRRHGEDPALRAMCTLILRDETGHIAFHRDRLAREGADASRTPYGAWWATWFRLLGLSAATMLWINHGPALVALGATRAEYYRHVQRGISVFTTLLRRDTQAARLARESTVAASLVRQPAPVRVTREVTPTAPAA